VARIEMVLSGGDAFSNVFLSEALRSALVGDMDHNPVKANRSVSPLKKSQNPSFFHFRMFQVFPWLG